MSKNTDFEQFFRENYKSLYHFALQMVADEEVCRDLVGDALAAAWARMDEVSLTKLKSYTYRLVHNKCVDHIRHETARARYADFYRAMYDDGTDDQTFLETEAQVTTMMELMKTMTPRTQEILTRCYFQRKKYAEVARELEISVSAVRKHIVGALKVFRAEMAKKV